MSGYTLQMDLMKLEALSKLPKSNNEDDFIRVEFKQTKVNQLMKVDPSDLGTSNKESYMIVN